MKTHFKIFSVLIIAAMLPRIYAADVRMIKPSVLLIEGEVTKGDYSQMIEVVLENGSIPSAVGISSPGGDAVEAMKVGHFIRKNHLPVMPI